MTPTKKISFPNYIVIVIVIDVFFFFNQAWILQAFVELGVRGRKAHVLRGSASETGETHGMFMGKSRR